MRRDRTNAAGGLHQNGICQVETWIGCRLSVCRPVGLSACLSVRASVCLSAAWLAGWLAGWRSGTAIDESPPRLERLR